MEDFSHLLNKRKTLNPKLADSWAPHGSGRPSPALLCFAPARAMAMASGRDQRGRAAVGRTAALQGLAQGRSATRKRWRPSGHGGATAPRHRQWVIQGGKRSGRRRRARGSSPRVRFGRRETGEGSSTCGAELDGDVNGGRRSGGGRGAAQSSSRRGGGSSG